MNEQELKKMLEDTGALLSGHFLLSSGLHSDKYVQCAKLLQYPHLAQIAGTKLAEKIKNSGFQLPEIVASPAIGGIVIGQEVARSLGVKHIFVEKDNTGKPCLRRGFYVNKGEHFVIVEDVVTTGKSTGEVFSLLKSLGAEPTMVVSIIDRSGDNELPFKAPFISLLKLELNTYSLQDCPLCKNKIPLEKPGSRKQI
ncbi:orotate phosphoribosyltransferase [bacterium]|nr:MAG: orotate phosphoribosyltransferase [bacterium]